MERLTFVAYGCVLRFAFERNVRPCVVTMFIRVCVCICLCACDCVIILSKYIFVRLIMVELPRVAAAVFGNIQTCIV